MYKFDARKVRDELVKWIANWFDQNGKNCNAIVGISGGLDSSVVAALCVEALGKDRVKGLLMPSWIQKDISDSHFLCEHLGINFDVMDIADAVIAIINQFSTNIEISKQAKINLPARIRMATLYAYSQSNKGRVANTSNLSESYVGYDTRWGDSVGDFSPLFNLTKTEIGMIAKELGLPDRLINKVPTDGLCGKTDEESFGFSYKVLDRYIRTGKIDDLDIKNKIDEMHENNLFKLQPISSYDPKIVIK